MRAFFTNYPYYVSYEQYQNCINRMVEKLAKQPSVVSILQIGSISTPGVSDIDLLIVFKDDAECFLSPLENLSKQDKYLFIHGLYGIPRKYYEKAQRYTFFHNYTLLWGEKLPISKNNLAKKDINILKIQTALEYMIKMYIILTVQRTYRIFNMRNLLLHTKALLYDLEFLNINSGNLFDLIKVLITWRQNWFEYKPSRRKLEGWVKAFYGELNAFLRTILKTQEFNFPGKENLIIGRNLTLVPGRHFGYEHKGIVLPPVLGWLGRKYFNVQHRFNRFRFFLPVSSTTLPVVIERQFSFFHEMKVKNQILLPHFMPLASALI